MDAQTSILNDQTTRASRDASAMRAPALFALTVAIFWLSLLLHEGAHFGVLQFVRSSITPASGKGIRAIAPAAGPIISLLLIAVCTIVARSTASERKRTLAFALAVSAASRLVLLAPIVVLGRGTNDETTVAGAMNVSPAVIWTAEFIVAFGMLAILHAYLPRPRLRVVLTVVVGVVVGWVSAFTLGRAIGLPI